MQKQVKMSRLTACPPCSMSRMLHVDIASDEAVHLLLSPSLRIIDLSLQTFRGLRSPPPRLWLACHSLHLWSRTNQAGEETCPTAVHAWLVLPMYARGEQKHSGIGFYFQNLSGVLMGSRSAAPSETRGVHLSSVQLISKIDWVYEEVII